MKTLVGKIILLILPFACLFPVLEYRLSQVEHNLLEKRAYLEAQLGEIEVLSTGSSHGNALNPALFSRKGFTLSNPAQDLYYDARLVDKYLERMPKLRLVIMPISPFAYEYQQDHSDAWMSGAAYFILWGIPPQHRDMLLHIQFFSYTAMYGWKAVLEYLGNGFVDTSGPEMDASGWRHASRGSMQDTPEERELAMMHIRGQESVLSVKAIPANVKLLSELIQKCQSRGIQVVLITTPVFRTYSDYLNPEQVARWLETSETISQQYNVPFFNYLKDARFDHEDFSNRDHLNAHGVEKFSTIIDEEIIQKYFPNTSEKP